jgi:hypothetical protein
MNITRIDLFHAHLDLCSQCKNNPFNLCSIGATLLLQAWKNPSKEIKKNASNVSNTRRL